MNETELDPFSWLSNFHFNSAHLSKVPRMTDCDDRASTFQHCHRVKKTTEECHWLLRRFSLTAPGQTLILGKQVQQDGFVGLIQQAQVWLQASVKPLILYATLLQYPEIGHLDMSFGNTARRRGGAGALCGLRREDGK